MSFATGRDPRAGTIGSSMYIRVVSTVLGEKLGAWSGHSLQSSATVPFPVDATGRWSTGFLRVFEQARYSLLNCWHFDLNPKKWTTNMTIWP